MVKFAHLADCHLGSWRQEELRELNFRSFQLAIEKCIRENLEFVLISGDLFDSAYPPIEILKETFAEFRKLHDAQIPVYLIAGSHDFSASGKTFLDVLKKAGFCKNAENFEVQEDGRIKLIPQMHGDTAIFGYSGKKSGMEIEDLRKVEFDSVYPSTIFMIHTTIKDVVGNIPMDSIEREKLPLANYYAMGHIHQRFEKQEANSTFVYPGPIFPNNFQELVDLKHGGFQIVEMQGATVSTKNIELPIKEIVFVGIDIDNGLIATEKIIAELDRLSLSDKVVLLKLSGTLTQGKSGDIKFNEIEEFIKKKGAYSFLRNISSLKMTDTELELGSTNSEDVEEIEKQIMGGYSKKHPADFNKFLPQLMTALSMEKNEDEKGLIYEERIVDELKNVLEIGEFLK
jgi:DNA repair protein SbcD/Mre11